MASPYRIVVLQAALALAAGASFAVWDAMHGDWNFRQAQASVLAGLASWLPAAVYAWQAGRERSASRFLLMGVVKFGLTLVLMALGIAAFGPEPAGFFATLIAMQLMYVVGPLSEHRPAEAGKPAEADDAAGN